MFCKDVIAGHIGTGIISGDEDYHEVYHDGASHYYIDGTVWESKKIPVLVYGIETGQYRW